jgi:hypothetical protein
MSVSNAHTYADSNTERNSYSYANGHTSIHGGQLQSRGWGTGCELGQAGAGIGTDAGDHE